MYYSQDVWKQSIKTNNQEITKLCLTHLDLHALSEVFWNASLIGRIILARDSALFVRRQGQQIIYNPNFPTRRTNGFWLHYVIEQQWTGPVEKSVDRETSIINAYQHEAVLNAAKMGDRQQIEQIFHFFMTSDHENERSLTGHVIELALPLFVKRGDFEFGKILLDFTKNISVQLSPYINNQLRNSLSWGEIKEACNLVKFAKKYQLTDNLSQTVTNLFQNQLDFGFISRAERTLIFATEHDLQICDFEASFALALQRAFVDDKRSQRAGELIAFARKYEIPLPNLSARMASILFLAVMCNGSKAYTQIVDWCRKHGVPLHLPQLAFFKGILLRRLICGLGINPRKIYLL